MFRLSWFLCGVLLLSAGGCGSSSSPSAPSSTQPRAEFGQTDLRVGTGTTGNLGSGAVVLDGALNLNRSDTLTIANDISGNGQLGQGGAGIAILTGTNTYAGVTTITTGINHATRSHARDRTSPRPRTSLTTSPTLPCPSPPIPR